jgi:putative Holliday junction resolvase
LGRILAIDYGQKRVGIASTDILQISANGLETVSVNQIMDFIDQYIQKEPVEEIVIGYPVKLNNKPSEAIRYINPFIKNLTNKYPEKKVVTFDERFTSKMALQAMIDGGMKKNQRRDKSVVDKISATIMLQSYMEYKKHKFN